MRELGEAEVKKMKLKNEQLHAKNWEEKKCGEEESVLYKESERGRRERETKDYQQRKEVISTIWQKKERFEKIIDYGNGFPKKEAARREGGREHCIEALRDLASTRMHN